MMFLSGLIPGRQAPSKTSAGPECRKQQSVPDKRITIIDTPAGHGDLPVEFPTKSFTPPRKKSVEKMDFPGLLKLLGDDMFLQPNKTAKAQPNALDLLI